jgi:hypothetical protein
MLLDLAVKSNPKCYCVVLLHPTKTMPTTSVKLSTVADLQAILHAPGRTRTCDRRIRSSYGTTDVQRPQDRGDRSARLRCAQLRRVGNT